MPNANNQIKLTAAKSSRHLQLSLHVVRSEERSDIERNIPCSARTHCGTTEKTTTRTISEDSAIEERIQNQKKDGTSLFILATFSENTTSLSDRASTP